MIFSGCRAVVMAVLFLWAAWKIYNKFIATRILLQENMNYQVSIHKNVS